MNKPIYLGLSILELSKGFWYDYVKPKYVGKAILRYMEPNSLIWYLKSYDNYKEIAEDVCIKFDTSNYELDRPLPKGGKINK